MTTVALATRRYGPDEARFHRLRLSDGVSSWWARDRPRLAAHAHLNLARQVRGRRHVLALVDHVDARCAAFGIDRWHGEINAPVGRRAAALAAHGGIVTAHGRNHTLSWLRATPIERLTVVRRVPSARMP